MAKDPRDISFATFNLYNLQLPNERWRHNASPYTQDEYDKKIQWTSHMLGQLDADVIAFQELWSAQCLRDAFAKAGLASQYKLHFIRDEWYDIAVAIAVRDPWDVSKTALHKSFPEEFRLLKRGYRGGDDEDREDDDISVSIDKFSRTILQASIIHKDYGDLTPIEILACHLKSKLPTRLDKAEYTDDNIRPHSTALGAALSTIRRTAEAAALRVVLNTLLRDTDAPVVVMGDLNDGQMSNTLSIITEQPAYRLYESSGTGSRSDRGLYASGTLQEFRSLRDVYYTHTFKGVRESLDHILVSEQFYDHSRRRIWAFHEMRVWNDHIDDQHDKSMSDHGLVRAHYIYDPA